MTQLASRIAASYDAANENPQTDNHWRYAGAWSADATIPSHVRRTIRNRARYECVENNGYAVGIVSTLVNDMIGRGPRLQWHGDTPEENAAVETQWQYWAHAVDLNCKLATLARAKTVDGEGVALLRSNPDLSNPVELDVLTLECDRLSSPFFSADDTRHYFDGIHLDDFRHPIAYDILDDHPGSVWADGPNLLTYQTYKRPRVLHWFTPTRPEQTRGVSELAPVLDHFANLRRYTRAVLAAAETAANHALVIETDSPAETQDEVDAQWQAKTVGPNTYTVMPHAWKLSGFKSEQPTTTYPMFKREIVAEIARALSMPYNIAAADSSGYNYASGRLDHQVYDRKLKCEQRSAEHEVLNRLLTEWLKEAALVGVLPPGVAADVLEIARAGNDPAMRLAHSWQWDRRPHVDPSKEAMAQAVRLSSGTVSRRAEIFEAGSNIDEIDTDNAAAYGFESVEAYRQTLAAKTLGAVVPTADDGSDADDGAADDLAAVKAQFDAYGVAVRSGAITPQQADEIHFRKALGLPAPDAAVAGAWSTDEGTRRPVTITPPPTDAAPEPNPNAAGVPDEQ